MITSTFPNRSFIIAATAICSSSFAEEQTDQDDGFGLLGDKSGKGMLSVKIDVSHCSDDCIIRLLSESLDKCESYSAARASHWMDQPSSKLY